MTNYTHNADVSLWCARARACCCVWGSSSLLSLSPAPPAVFSSSGCRGQCDNGAGATGSPPWPSGVDTLAFSDRGWKLQLLEPLQTATVELSDACQMYINVSIERNEAQKTEHDINLMTKSCELYLPLCVSVPLRGVNCPSAQFPGHGELLRGEAEGRRQRSGPRFRFHALVRVFQRLQERLGPTKQDHLKGEVSRTLLKVCRSQEERDSG